MTVLGVGLLTAALFTGVGLIVGWWFLPQPGFVRRIGEKLGLVK